MRTWIYSSETDARSPVVYMTNNSLDQLKELIEDLTDEAPNELEFWATREKKGWSKVLDAKKKGAKKESFRVIASEWRAKKTALLGRIRVVRFLALANKAVEPERWTGPYVHFKSHPKQLYAMILCLFYLGQRVANSCLRYIDSPEDILAYAVDYFTVSNQVEKRMVKQKQAGKHLVLNGHGCFDARVGTTTVPAGKFIHFYTARGSVLGMKASQRIEGSSQGQPFLIPLETFEAGETIENYFLGHPTGVTVNVNGWSGGLGDMVIQKDKNRMVALSSLLKSARCQQARHIHWCACREDVTGGDHEITWPGPWLERELKGTGHTGTEFGKDGLIVKQTGIPSYQGA